MNVAIYPGSFDPITLGHLDVIERMARFYDEFYVVVSVAAEKQGFFSVEKRVEMIQGSISKSPNIKVISWKGLTVDCAKKLGAGVIIRGIRVVSDFEHEMGLAQLNKTLAPNIETLIVPCKGRYSFVSSRRVKELALHGGEVKDFVPESVVKAFKQR